MQEMRLAAQCPCYPMCMIFRHEYEGGVWVDLEQPNEEEIRGIAEEFSINEQFEKELLYPTPTPMVSVDGETTLLVLHFPAHAVEEGDTSNQEVDFAVGKNFIVTVRYEVVAPLYHLKKLLETRKLVAGKDSITTDVLLEVLFVHLYTSVRDQTNHVANHLEHVEKDMFDGRERMTIRSISNINREFLHIESCLANQEEPLERFFEVLAGHKGFGTAFKERAERVLAERAQIARLITTYRAVATELRETNLALLESRQNDIMKTLTLITVFVLPLELIAVTLEIKAPGTPAIVMENPNAFWFIIGLMLATVALMAIYFARKRWLS